MRPIAEEHDELFHYTSAVGLSGIVASGSLWATHFSFLNDHEEYKLFFERRLPVLLLRIPVNVDTEFGIVEGQNGTLSQFICG